MININNINEILYVFFFEMLQKEISKDLGEPINIEIINIPPTLYDPETFIGFCGIALKINEKNIGIKIPVENRFSIKEEFKQLVKEQIIIKYRE